MRQYVGGVVIDLSEYDLTKLQNVFDRDENIVEAIERAKREAESDDPEKNISAFNSGF